MNPPVKQFRKRNAILAYLKETKEHPSAEMVFTHLKPEIPDLSLGTVYRNLTKFREQGDIISLGAVNGVERFDGNTNPHVHFICQDCDAVLDLMQMDIPPSLQQAAEAACGGSVHECNLCFTGTCRECTTK